MAAPICRACDKPVLDDFVIVGLSDNIPGAERIELHPGGLTGGVIEEITSLALREPTSCPGIYLTRDQKPNNLYYSEVIPVGQLSDWEPKK